MKIISSEELKNENYQLKMKKSLEGLEEEKIAIKSQVFGYIAELGGVREDVFEFLLANNFNSSRAFANSAELLCSNADVKWFEMINQIQERSNTVYWILEIIRNFSEGVPMEKAEEFLNESRTPFEMGRMRVAYLEKQGTQGNQNILKTIETVEKVLEECSRENEEYRSKISELSLLIEKQNKQLEEKMAQPENSENYSQLKEQLANKVAEVGFYHNLYKEVQQENSKQQLMIAELQERIDEQAKIIYENISMGNTLNEDTGSDECIDMVVPEDSDNEIESIKSEEYHSLEDMKIPSCENQMVQPPVENGSEMYDHRLLYNEIKEKERVSGERVTFFKTLLKIYGKKQFLKLDKERQVTKLIETMVHKQFDKSRILSIKKLMNGGMTTEFLYGLIEKDTSADELAELCEVLLNNEIQEMPEEVVSEEYEDYETYEEDEEIDEDEETMYS